MSKTTIAAEIVRRLPDLIKDSPANAETVIRGMLDELDNPDQNGKLVFIQALDRAIKFHRNNTSDPYNVGNAVIVSLQEVRDAFKAYLF